MKKILIGLAFVFGAVLVGVVLFLIPRYEGIKPVISDPPESISELLEGQGNTTLLPVTSTPSVGNTSPVTTPGTSAQEAKNTTGFPLVLPAGFSIEVFAKNAPGARVMVFDSQGDLWVSRMSKGIVTLYDVENGKVVGQKDVFKNLKNPHGLAIRHEENGNADILYIAEEDKISTAIVRRNDIGAVPGANVSAMTDIEKVDMSLAVSSFIQPNKIKDLTGPGLGSGMRHKSRTIAFGPDGRLYVSIGSTCDVCHEESELPGKIFSMKADGTDWREEAKGLRNSVFFTWNPIDGRMWATDMGRDRLGDNLPPDEINIVEKGKNYGWPICYGNNVHDTSFDKNIYIRNPCMEPFETPSYIDLPAHVAPLGLSFIPEEGWPETYWHNLLVSYHGSWNSSKPVGYKVARIILDAKGNVKGTEDFISGFLTKDNKALGRPVDIIVQPGGVVYISDDHAGVIYRVWYNGK